MLKIYKKKLGLSFEKKKVNCLTLKQKTTENFQGHYKWYNEMLNKC